MSETLSFDTLTVRTFGTYETSAGQVLEYEAEWLARVYDRGHVEVDLLSVRSERPVTGQRLQTIADADWSEAMDLARHKALNPYVIED